MIGHLVRVASSLLRERAKKKKRSPQWDNVQRAFKKAHPTCAACGGKTLIQIHHIAPYSNAPDRELDPTNLITTCMGKFECHLRIAHGGNWRRYNPKVLEHAREARERPAYRKEIEAKARAARLD